MIAWYDSHLISLYIISEYQPQQVLYTMYFSLCTLKLVPGRLALKTIYIHPVH